MRKLKLSLICIFAAVLCCAVAAFISIHFISEAQKYIDQPETTTEISAPELGVEPTVSVNTVTAPTWSDGSTSKTFEYAAQFSATLHNISNYNSTYMTYSVSTGLNFITAYGAAVNVASTVTWGTGKTLTVTFTAKSGYSLGGASSVTLSLVLKPKSVTAPTWSSGGTSQTVDYSSGINMGSTLYSVSNYSSTYMTAAVSGDLGGFMTTYSSVNFKSGSTYGSSGSVTFTAIDGYTLGGSLTVTLTIKVATLSISPTFKYGSSDTTTFTYGTNSVAPTVSGNTGSGTVTYRSSNTAVATVNSSTGVITPVKVGTATITMSIAASGQYSSATVTKSITISKATPSLTLTYGTVTYGGSAVTPTLSGNSGSGTVSYSVASGTGKATISSTTGALTPTQAGTVSVTVTVASTTNYNSASKTVSVTINKATPSLTLTYGTVTYGGSAVAPTLSGNSGSGTATYTVASGTGKATISSSTGALTPTQAGTVSVTVTVASTTNYNSASKTVSVTINKATPTLTLTYGTVTYGTTSAAPTLSGNSGGGTASYTVAAGTGKATIGTTGALTPTQAGTVSVTVTVASTTNYNSASKTVSVTINKATPTLTLTYGTVTYGTTSAAPTLSGNSGGGTASYTVAAGTGKATISTAGVLTPTQAGTVSVTVTVASTTNYNSATKTVSVTINKATPSLTLTYGTVTYNTTSAAPTLSGNTGGGTVSYTVAAGTGKATINSSTGALTPTQAGTVSVTVTVASTTNYNSATKTVSVTINKVTPSLTLTYGTVTYGTNSAAPTLSGNGGSGTATFTVAAGTGKATISSTTGVLTPTQAGTVSVTVTVASTTNYNSATKTVSVTINKASISPSLSYGTVTYGSTASPTLSGNSGSGTVTWSSSSTTVATVSTSGVVTPVKVGTVTITASIAATTNYAAGTATATITINRATITAALSSTNLTYSTNTQTVTLSNYSSVTTELPAGWSITDGTITIPAGEGADSYIITVTPDGNHCWSGGVTTAKTITVTINKASLTLTLTYGTVTYGTVSDEPTLGGNSGNGAVSYTIAEGTGIATVDGVTGVIDPIFPGTVNVTVSVEETANYLAGSKTVTVTINKITPTATVSVLEGYHYVGDELSTVIISVGESSVAGSVKWTNPDALISGVAESYGWTFTPEASDYYSEITGNAQVTAYYKLTGITVTGAKTTYNAYESFDPTGMTVTASYLMGKVDTAVTGYTLTYPSAGLNYFLVADDGKNLTITYNENGITVTATLIISVNKADYDMSGVTMDNLTVTYDGEIHSITYAGTLPKGVYVDGYLYNGEAASYAIDASTYTVEARIRIADTANYNVPELKATLIIVKATPTASASVMDGYYYVGDALSSVTVSIGDSSVAGTIAWNNPDALIMGVTGNYSWVFTPDDAKNYNEVTGTAHVAAYYKLTGITVTGAKSTYKAYESFDPTGMTVTASYAAGKVDTAVTDYTFIYPTAGVNYFLISDDYKELTISYTENGITVTAGVIIVIDANEYDMSGVTMGDLTVDYDGEYHVITMSGKLPDGVTIVGYKYDGETNAIGVKDAGVYTVEAIFVIADPDNYKMPRLSATLTINKATPTATAGVMEGYYYVGDELSTVTVSVIDSSVAGTIAWTNGSAVLTGATGSYSWTFTPEDTDNYKVITGTAQVTAYYKLTGITVTGAKTTYKAHEAFDTTGMTVTASYFGKASAAVTDYTVIYPTAGLNYFITADDGKSVTISYTEGGITVTTGVIIVIDANEYDMTGVEMNDLTVDFDGDFHAITITGTLPEGVRVTGYTYNGEASAQGVKVAGTYVVEAVFEIDDPDNYKPPRLSAILTINKATPTAAAAVDGGYYYVGDELSTVNVTVGESSVAGTIAWTNGSALIAAASGSYGWTFTPEDTDNYKVITGTVEVTAYYKLTGITVTGAKTSYKPYETFDTAGMTVTASYAAGKTNTAVTEYTITYPTSGQNNFVITDDGKDLIITYTESGITVTANLTIYIEANEYDMSGVRLDNVTATYDGEYHSLSYTGTLPEGVRITGYKYNGEYSALGVMDVGIYEVEAVIEISDPENYKMPKLTAILVINKGTPTATASVLGGYYYVGDLLSTAVISVGESSVSGTIKWTNASAIITSTNGSYSWTFTPDDTDNYKTVTGTAQVEAYYKLTGITVTGAKTTYKAYESFDPAGMTITASYAAGKANTAVTDYTITYPTAGLQHFIITDDGKSVTVTYSENGITVTANVTIYIEANEYDMSGVTLNNSTVDYDGEYHTLTLTGELPDGVKIVGYTYNGEYLAQGVMNAGVYTVEAIITIADPDNYKMPKLSATLIINKATASVTPEILSVYNYVGDKLETVLIGIGSSDVAGKLTWTNGSTLISVTVGSYSWTFTPDDTDNYKTVSGTVQVEAFYKLTGITVTGAQTTFKAHESFDPAGMTVTASYASGKVNTAVTDYSIIYPTDGLDYFVIYDDGKNLIISYTENGITVTASVTISIDANEYDMSGVEMSDETLTYDGENHTITFTGTLPEGVTITGYTYNGTLSADGVINAGTYIVEAVFEIADPENYKMPKLTATLVIEKATPTATAEVMPVYYYVGDALNSVKLNVGESSVSGIVKWTDASAKIDGTSGGYSWTFVPDDSVNYNEITGTVEIIAYYKVTGITVTGAINSYKPYQSFDPTGMTVTASYATGKADEEVTDYYIAYPTSGASYFLIYDDGKQVTVSYTENGITVTEGITISIEANEYDMSGVEMSDETLTYDGLNHTLTLTGELPDGVTLIGYSYNGEVSSYGVINAGTYIVEAVFEIADPDNYKMPKLSATLVINKATTTASVKVLEGNYYVGDGLDSVKLILTGSNVVGTLNWTNKNSLIMGLTGNYGWTFTPYDTENYESCTGTVQVTAYYKLVGLILIGANDFYKPYDSFSTDGLTVIARYYVGKSDTVVTDYTVTYPTEGLNYFLISDDGKDLIISYTENGITVMANVTIVIDADEYDMTGVSMEDLTLTYDGAFHTITLTGELPEGVTLVGYTYNGEATLQGVKNAGTYLVEAVFEIDNPEQFKMPRLSATLTINQIETEATVTVADGIYFVGDSIDTVKLVLENSSVNGTVVWTDLSAQISGAIGSYGWTFIPDDNNYATFTGTVEVIAYYKLTGITVTGAKNVYRPNDTFDPAGMLVIASYAAGKGNTVVTDYSIIYPTETDRFVIYDDGKDVIISYTENGITVTATVTVKIDANEYDMSGVRMENLTVTYDGKNHTVTITGNLPDGVTVTGYTYNGEENADGVINAGTYVVEAVFEIADPENYKMPELTATLVIEKAQTVIDVSEVETVYTYDGKLQTVNSGAAIDNEEQEIKYSNNTFTTVAEGNGLEVKITVEETANYLADSKTVIITVNKALSKIDISDVETEYVYTGELQTVNSGATVDNDEQEVKYSNNTFTSVAEGDGLKVNVYVEETDNYLASSIEVEISVDRAKVENSVTFTGKTVTYDGATQSLALEGTLADDMTVIYYYAGTTDVFDGVTDAGTYTVVAHFVCTSGNYYDPEDMTATLTVLPYELDESEVVGVLGEYGYKGEAWKPEPTVTVTLAEGAVVLDRSCYAVEYSTEDYAVGTEVTVTITVNCNGNIIGTVEKLFVITKATLEVVWSESANGYVYNGTRQGVTVNGVNGFADGDAFNYTVTYTGRGATNYSSTLKPMNAGLYTVTITFDDDGVFENYKLASEGALSKQFEILKADVTIEEIYIEPYETLYEGGKLPQISIVGSATSGSLTVSGQLAWQQTDGVPSVLELYTHEYAWIFTPTDTDNYNILTGKIEFTAVQATVYEITVDWRDDIVIPKIYTSTTLNELRNYLTVKGLLEGEQGEVEIAGYDIAGEWGSAPSPDTDKAGTYTVTVSFKGLHASIDVVYNAILIIDIKVEAATPDGITKDYYGLDLFDRDSIIVTIVYNDNTEQVIQDYKVLYNDGHEELWAGDTSVTISYNNGSLDEDMTREITGLSVIKRVFDMSSITLDDTVTDYDGTAKAYEIKGEFKIGTVTYTYQTLEDGVWVTVPAANVINAGEYQVTVKFTLGDGKYAANYYDDIATRQVTLTILKVDYDGVDNIAFENTVTDYDYGNPVASVIEELLANVPEGVKVTYVYTDADGNVLQAEEVVNAGKYYVTVKFQEDENHYAIAPLTNVEFTVKKLTPEVTPSVGGNLAQGTMLSQLTFVNGTDGVEGSFSWVNGGQELKAGVNRCYFVFTPDDATNYETVTAYIDLEIEPTSAGVSIGSNDGGVQDWLWILLVVVTGVSIVLAIGAIIAAAKKKGASDDDGFYDDVTEADLI